MTILIDDWQKGIDSIQRAFPNRQIKIKNAGDGGIIKNLFMGAFWTLLGLAIFIYGVTVGLDALEDQKFSNNYNIVNNAQVDGECNNIKNLPFILSCHLDIVTNDGRQAESDFYFLSFSIRDPEIQVIEQRDNPNNITVDLAVNHLKNRYTTVVIFWALGLFGFYLGIITWKNIPKKNRLKAIMNDPINQPWKVVAIPVEVYSGESIDFKTDIDGKLMPISIDRAKPIIMADISSSQKIALGIQADKAPTYVPLTKKLSSLKLKKDEKKEIIAVINRYFG